MGMVVTQEWRQIQLTVKLSANNAIVTNGRKKRSSIQLSTNWQSPNTHLSHVRFNLQRILCETSKVYKRGIDRWSRLLDDWLDYWIIVDDYWMTASWHVLRIEIFSFLTTPPSLTKTRTKTLPNSCLTFLSTTQADSSMRSNLSSFDRQKNASFPKNVLIP